MNVEFIDVPRDFKISCELIGVKVPDFLQLIVDHFCFVHIHMHDQSEYDMATKAFLAASYRLGKKEIKPAEHLSTSQRDDFIRLFRQLLKIVMNRNYSFSERRKKGKVRVSKLFSTYSKGLKVKEVIYFDEETKIQLSKDFLMFTLFHQCSPIELINSMIKKVSYAEFAARYDLKEEEHNPAISFFIRVMDGYGGIQNRAYLESHAFKEFFLWDVQEFRTRYFFYRKLEDRIDVYRERLEENYEQINKNLF